MKKFSLGVGTIRVLPAGKTAEADIKTLGEQVEGTDTMVSGEKEIIEHLAKGKNGPVMSVEGRTTTTVVVSCYLEADLLAEIFPNNVESPATDVYDFKSAISKEVLPVGLDIRPLGETAVTNCIYFPVAYPKFQESFDYSLEGPMKVDFEFKIAEDENNILFTYGKEIPATT